MQITREAPNTRETVKHTKDTTSTKRVTKSPPKANALKLVTAKKAPAKSLVLPMFGAESKDDSVHSSTHLHVTRPVGSAFQPHNRLSEHSHTCKTHSDGVFETDHRKVHSPASRIKSLDLADYVKFLKRTVHTEVEYKELRSVSGYVLFFTPKLHQATVSTVKPDDLDAADIVQLSIGDIADAHRRARRKILPTKTYEQSVRRELANVLTHKLKKAQKPDKSRRSKHPQSSIKRSSVKHTKYDSLNLPPKEVVSSDVYAQLPLHADKEENVVEKTNTLTAPQVSKKSTTRRPNRRNLVKSESVQCENLSEDHEQLLATAGSGSYMKLQKHPLLPITATQVGYVRLISDYLLLLLLVENASLFFRINKSQNGVMLIK